MKSQNRNRVEPGQTIVIEHSYSQADFDKFARLSGDDNPIHIDPDFASQTNFGRTVCHGMLLYSTICAILSNNLLDPGLLHLQQDLMFTAPTFAEEPIRMEITILGFSDSDIHLSTNVVHPDDTYACKGEARVTSKRRLFPRESVEKDQIENNDAVVLKGLKIGQKAHLRRAFHQEELAHLAELTGDSNPLNFDADYARRLGFRDQLVPPGLLGGMFSSLLGTKLPGRGTMWLKQRLDFWFPAYPQEVLTASVEVARLRPDKNLVNLLTEIRNPEMKLVCSGEALVLVRYLMAVV